MLIHVTRYVAVQRPCSRASRGDRAPHAPEDHPRQRRDELLAQMRKLWDEDFVPTRDEVAELSPARSARLRCPRGTKSSRNCPMSRRHRSALDQRHGQRRARLRHARRALKVIAVGGDKLARGLTLEGLCVSYFVRTTKMYDTLMQMGRWFGYRPRIPGPLPPLHVAGFGEMVRPHRRRLRGAARRVRLHGEAKLTPEQYGLKVMSHEVLTVTSP
jgi:hypothetical protein